MLVPVYILALAYWTPERAYCRDVALAIFLTACITDALDGWIARSTRQKTRLGSLIDPVADKILLTSAFLAFACIPGIPVEARLPIWLTVLVVSRDLLLLTGSAVIFIMHNRFDPQTHWLGKLTTVCQMALVIGVLANLPAKPHQAFLILAATATTLLSGAVYLKAGVKRLGGGAEHA